MLVFSLCFAIPAIAIPGLIWFFFIEYSFCQKSIFPNTESLSGVKNILLIRANGSEEIGNGSIDRGFRVFEKGNLIAEFKEFFNEQIVIGMKRTFHYRNVKFGFQIEPDNRKVAFYEGGTKIGTFKRSGFGYKKKSIDLLGSNLSFLDIEKWNPDFDVFDEEIKVATVTYERNTSRGRDRKLCFFESVSIQKEAVLCMVAAFCPPKFGNIGG